MSQYEKIQTFVFWKFIIEVALPLEKMRLNFYFL